MSGRRFPYGMTRTRIVQTRQAQPIKTAPAARDTDEIHSHCLQPLIAVCVTSPSHNCCLAKIPSSGLRTPECDQALGKRRWSDPLAHDQSLGGQEHLHQDCNPQSQPAGRSCFDRGICIWNAATVSASQIGWSDKAVCILNAASAAKAGQTGSSASGMQPSKMASRRG